MPVEIAMPDFRELEFAHHYHASPTERLRMRMKSILKPALSS